MICLTPSRLHPSLICLYFFTWTDHAASLHMSLNTGAWQNGLSPNALKCSHTYLHHGSCNQEHARASLMYHRHGYIIGSFRCNLAADDVRQIRHDRVPGICRFLHGHVWACFYTVHDIFPYLFPLYYIQQGAYSLGNGIERWSLIEFTTVDDLLLVRACPIRLLRVG